VTNRWSKSTVVSDAVGLGRYELILGYKYSCYPCLLDGGWNETRGVLFASQMHLAHGIHLQNR
jgi:hypothetical protein